MINNRSFPVLLFFVFLLATSFAQQGEENPFELRHRMLEPVAVEKPEATPEAAKETGNPFDITRAGTGNSAKPVVPQPRKKVTPQATPGDGSSLKKFKFWLLLGMFFILGILLSLYRGIMVGTYRAFLNGNYLKLLHRQNAKVSLIPYYLLYGLFFISMGTFLFLIVNHFSDNAFFNFTNLLGAILGTTAIYLLKHFVLYFVGRVFPVSKEISQYGFTIMIFSILLGIFLVPVNAVLMNSEPSMASFVIYATIGICVVILLFRTLRSLFLASKYISFHKFHFFMYLCTVEIAPVLILLKIVLLNTGVQ